MDWRCAGSVGSPCRTDPSICPSRRYADVPLRYYVPMRLKLRFALLCLLIVALPFKAMAGVVMLGCGPGHHSFKLSHAVAASEAGAAQAVHHHEDGGGHSHATGPSLHEAGASGASGASDGAQSGDKSPSPHQGKMSTGKCGSCAPCCVAAAPTSDPAVAIGHIASGDAWLSFSDSYSGVVGEVPHEPPRSILG